MLSSFSAGYSSTAAVPWTVTMPLHWREPIASAQSMFHEIWSSALWCSVQLVCADKWRAARSGHFLLASLSPLGAMDSSRAINSVRASWLLPCSALLSLCAECSVQSSSVCIICVFRLCALPVVTLNCDICSKGWTSNKYCEQHNVAPQLTILLTCSSPREVPRVGRPEPRTHGTRSMQHAEQNTECE